MGVPKGPLQIVASRVQSRGGLEEVRSSVSEASQRIELVCA
jgi:hypothetical protein